MESPKRGEKRMIKPPSWATGPHMDHLPTVEVRPAPDDTIDEIIAEGVAHFHMEQLDNGLCWIGLTLADGQVQHIRLQARQGSIYSVVYT